METREQRRAILMSAVEQFLDHIEDDFDDDPDYDKDGQLGAVVIAGEVHITPANSERQSVIPTFYSSNESPIWQRGMFTLLSEMLSILLGRD